MDKKVILITGASGALGKEITKYFEDKNVQLALHYNSRKIDREENENLQIIKADLTKEIQVEYLIQTVIEKFGRLDVVINNAGISKSSMSWKTSQINWQETIDINLTAPFFVSKYAIPEFRKNNWGRIINISSVVAQTGFIGTVAYAASKAGLLGMTKTLSKEVAPFNVTVNALALGYFNTGMIDDVPEEIQEEIIKSVPMKKLGEPSTIAKTIELLMSEEGNFITGQTFNLNGGLF